MKLNKQTLTTLRYQIDAALKAVLADKNLEGSIGTITYDSERNTASMRVNLKPLPGTTEALDIERHDWIRSCSLYGLKPEDYKAVVVINNESFTVEGFRTKARKNHVSVRRVRDAKMFTTSHQIVMRKLGRHVDVT